MAARPLPLSGRKETVVHGVGLDSSAVRQSMVAKLAQQGMTDAAVLQAMGRIERHRLSIPRW
jgi:protein-L-isoaspartate(D-aspartate) O-methyltransferase